MSKVALSPKQRNANSALKTAVKRTKSKLAKVAKKKTVTVVTYPKGVYQKTLKSELCTAMKEVNLAKTCKTGRSKYVKDSEASAKKKRVTKSVKPKVTAKKKSVAAKPKVKKTLAAPKAKKAASKKSRRSSAKKSTGFFGLFGK